MATLSPHCRAGRRLRRRVRLARRLYLRRRIAAKRSVCRRSTPHTARRGLAAKSRRWREERGVRVVRRLAARAPCCRPPPHTARREACSNVSAGRRCGGSRRREVRRLTPPRLSGNSQSRTVRAKDATPPAFLLFCGSSCLSRSSRFGGYCANLDSQAKPQF